jgi:hypothetical protein
VPRPRGDADDRVIREQVPADQMIRPTDGSEAVRFALHVSPACVIPGIIFQRPGASV